MTNKKRNILAMLIAVLMVVAMMPSVVQEVFAEPTQQDAIVKVSLSDRLFGLDDIGRAIMGVEISFDIAELAAIF